MSLFCPNTNSAEYKHLADIFGDELAHYMWNKNGGNPLHLTKEGEPSRLYQNLVELTGHEVLATLYKGKTYTSGFIAQYGDWLNDPKENSVDENGEPLVEKINDIFALYKDEFDHPDKRISADLARYGDEINDWNNSYVWDVEKKYKLINRWETEEGGKRKKYYNVFSFNKANTLANKIRVEDGLNVIIRRVYSKDPSKVGKWIVIVNKNVGLPTKELFGIYDTNLSNRKDAKPLTDMFNTFLKDVRSVKDVLNKIQREDIDILDKRHDLQSLMHVFRRNIDNLGEDANIFPGGEVDGAMSHEIDQRTGGANIFLNKEYILKYPSREAFVQGILHEVAHAFTMRAMIQPEDANDIEFKTKITSLYKTVKNSEWYGDGTGFGTRIQAAMENEREFVSYYLTDPEFSEFLKIAEPTGIWRQILEAIISFFTGKSGEFYNIADEVESAFRSFMSTQSSAVVSNQHLLNYRNIKHYTKLKDDLTSSGTNKTRAQIEKIMRNVASKMSFNEAEHTYTHIETGEQFIPVTEFLAEFGYGSLRGEKTVIYKNQEYIVQEGKIEYNGNIYLAGESFTGVVGNKDWKILIEGSIVQSKAFLRGGNLGTAIHKTINGQIGDLAKNIYEETGFEINKEAEEDLRKILDRIRSGEFTVLSEIIVADIEKKIAGTVDLVLIDNRSRLHIYDFKNKEKGFSDYQIQYKDSKGNKKPSEQKKYRMQLSAYKHIIEKSLGLYVEDMHVVMLTPTVNDDNVISRVNLDITYDSSGMDTFKALDEAFLRIYQEEAVTFKEKKSVENKARDERQQMEDSFEGEEFLDYVQRKSRLDEVENLLEKTKQSLHKRLELLQTRYSYEKRKGFELFVKNVDKEEKTPDAFLSIVVFASKVTDQLWAKYQNIKKGAEKFTPEILYQFKDYLLAYEQLDELLKLSLSDTGLFSDPNTIKLLEDTVNKKNFLRDLYKTEGKYLIAKWLTPYYNRFRTQAKEVAAGDYRKNLRNLRKEEGLTLEQARERSGTQEEYIQNIYLGKERSLDERTYNFLLEELTVASRDVGDITRWLDNMLDTSDAVAAAMVHAWVAAEEQSRLEAITKSTDFINELTALYKELPKGAIQGEQDYYSWIVDGQYRIKPWTSEIIEKEREIRTKLSRILTEDEFSSQLKAQLDSMRVLNVEEFNNALNNYLKETLKEGSITDKEYDTIKKARIKGKKIEDLAKDGLISEEASEFLLAWIYNNRPFYYNYKEEYQSPKWNKFMKELGISIDQPLYTQQKELEKSTHPKARFYNFIDKIAIEADTMLPYSFRIGHRLPGVAKISSERIKEGQDPLTYLKETARSDLFVRPEDTERGNKEFTDEQGNIKYFLPIHYTAKLEPENQSYDIPGIYLKFWESANSHSIKRNILSSMEMAKYFVDTRRANKRNALGKIIERIGFKYNEDDKPEAATINNTNVAAMLGDWFEMAVYGKKSKDASKISLEGKLITKLLGGGVELDVTKLVDAMNRYTSLNLLGFNLVQGTANVLIGETMQAIDAIAGEHVNSKEFSIASLKYSAWLPGMMGDIGLMRPKHVGSLLIERFNILHGDPMHIDLSKISRVGQLATTNTIFALQKAGEHWMQGRFLFARLIRKRAVDSTGKDLGSMINQYYSKDGKLMIKPEVDLVKSKWTEADQLSFMRKTKGLLSRMHGEYSDLGRVALQRMALGRMAYMFRKFVVPGMKRRWQKSQYIERLDQTVEGNYRTTMRFAGQMMKDLRGFKLALMAEDWSALSDHEKANIHRTISEVVFLVITIIMAGVAYRLKDEDDDERFWAFMAYQAYRLKTEMLFFTPKIDEAMSIFRSPMASMSIVENVIKLTTQLFDPLEVYERGPWKGDYKIKRTMINFIPVYKQYYKLRDVEEQIEWFRN